MGTILFAEGSKLSLGSSGASSSSLSEYTLYYNINCYDGHGAGGGDYSFDTTLDHCASVSDSCFVWMWDQNKCFPRTWCSSNPFNDCEYDTTESFATYVKGGSSPGTVAPFPQVERYTEYKHWNCYGGHGG